MKKKYNVVLCSLGYLPQYGGLVSYLKSFSRWVVESGGAATILTTDGKNGDLAEEEYIDGVRVLRKRAFTFSSVFKIFTPFLVARLIRAQIKENNDALSGADLIVIRHVYYAYAFLAFPKYLSKCVFVAPLISPRLQIINGVGKGFFYWAYSYIIAIQLYFIERKALKGMSIAVLSESKRDELSEYYRVAASKIAIVKPGIDVGRFRLASNEYERSKILNAIGRYEDVGKKIILTVCRLVEEKRVDALIDAFALLDHNCVLYVVGDGPLMHSLQRRAACLSKDVVFFGRRDDVELFYRVADVFALSSIYEGFGHVFLEALASGCVILGVKNNPPSIVTASEEIIISGSNGYISENIGALELSSALSKSLHLAETDSIRENNRRFVELQYSWSSHILKLDECK